MEDAEEEFEESGLGDDSADPEEGILASPSDEPHVHDAFDDMVGGMVIPETTHMTGEDGIPKPIDHGIEQALELALHPDTLVCMGTESRQVCRYYVRQMLSLGNNPEHQQVHRLCMMRQGASGAFVDVSGGVWACDLRDPPDKKSQNKLDVFDARKMAEGQERSSRSVFRK